MTIANEISKEGLRALAGKRVQLTQPNGAKFEITIAGVVFPRTLTSEKIAVVTESGTKERIYVSPDTDLSIIK